MNQMTSYSEKLLTQRELLPNSNILDSFSSLFQDAHLSSD